MKTRRARRSEAFWPSIVMKKWLNIKPKVYDFSEDDVDTETESEDDAFSLKGEKMHVGEDHASRIHGDQYIPPSRTSETPTYGYSLRHRRGKSETLRVQYISTKDVRVTIGTWNVAGRLPFEDLDIDEWLCTKEPADIYILGFQEVVPLNAGNVLGAENRRPILKWEAIIRRTLNKSLEPETKHKSYSAPPSPVLRTSAADIIADVVDPTATDMMSEELMGTANVRDNEILGMATNLKFKRIYGIDLDGGLDWPERSLDTTPQVLSSRFKLRRVLSTSGRVGSDWMEDISSSPYNVTLNSGGLKRLHQSSGNLGLIWVDQQEVTDQKEDTLDVLDSFSDASNEFSDDEDDASQAVSDLQPENAILEDDIKHHPKFVRIVSKQMVGIYVSVWVRRRLRRHINNLKVSPVGVGLMGYMGNKGSVSISMSLFQTRLCFVCSHLTSGHKDGDEHRRNSDVYEILRRTHFSSVFETDQPQTIQSHDQIFWFGDLNYRINMLDTEVRKLVAQKQWDELLHNDQLVKELRSGHVFDRWKEGMINFPPTYKYEFNSDRYVGEVPKEGEKKRTPAWCDRILWAGKGIKQLFYKRDEIRLSDHRPVSAMFLVEIDVFDHRKLQRALNFTGAVVHPEDFFEEGENFSR